MRTILLAAATSTALALSACTGSGPVDDPPSPAELAAAAADEFWTALAEEDLPAAAAMSDRPRQMTDLVSTNLDALSVTETSYELSGEPACKEQRCEQRVLVTHVLDGIGVWTYDTSTVLVEDEAGDFVVRWRPATLHPDLTAGTRLSRTRVLPPRASILGRDGDRLTRNRPVFRIGVVPGKVRARTYDALTGLLDIDPAGLRSKVDAAEPDWFVPVITLRESDYRPVSAALLEVPGVAVDPDTWSLSPSSTWGRALLGTVAPATKETLAAAGPHAAATDVVGASGLQLAFQEQLAGTPGGDVVLVDRKTGEQQGDILLTVEPKRGKALRTTLDRDLQGAAEAAVQQATELTALVAVQASTGEVLASAVGPGIQSYNTAFVGRYPPGSTFKMVSAAVLLEQDVVRPDDPVSCPATTTVGGRSFKNYDDFEPLPPDATFADAFAASCNTAIVNQAPKIDDQALNELANTLGIGGDWALGVDAYSGQVPVTGSEVERAASMIGQGKVLMSPLGMAMIAAAVQSGQPRAPALVPSAPTDGDELDPLPSDVVDDLRAMMRKTVQTGTASSLDLPGEPVYAKTGTAEYDSDDPSKTHAWMVGFRGDVAFAVLVDDGESGSEDAAPVARAFLETIAVATGR